MYYVITDNRLVSGRTLYEVNRKLNSKIEDREFKILGSDKIITLTSENLEFIQDKKRMSLIPIKNLYKKNNSSAMLFVVILILQFIILVKG